MEAVAIRRRGGDNSCEDQVINCSLSPCGCATLGLFVCKCAHRAADTFSYLLKKSPHSPLRGLIENIITSFLYHPQYHIIKYFPT